MVCHREACNAGRGDPALVSFQKARACGPHDPGGFFWIASSLRSSQ